MYVTHCSTPLLFVLTVVREELAYLLPVLFKSITCVYDAPRKLPLVGRPGTLNVPMDSEVPDENICKTGSCVYSFET